MLYAVQQPIDVQNAEAVAIFRRIASLGYKVTVQLADQQIEVRATDERTGELHRAVLSGDAAELEYRGACALSDLVVAELDN